MRRGIILGRWTDVMGERGSLTAIAEEEYETIEAAVMETARGRWFLAEFAQRNRTADTKMLLDAISRLEQAVTGERALQNMDRVRFDLMEMAKAIARTKSEIAAIQSPDQEQSRLMEASESLDAIVRTTERATSDILEAAENMQEAAWTLREKGADEDLCNELDRRATDIYTACSFQDLTAQRTGKIVNALRYLEGRINAMMDIWGADEEPAPTSAPRPSPEPAPKLSQGDVDTVIVDEELFCFAAPEPQEKAPAALPEPPGLFIEPDDLGFIDAPALPPPSPPEAPRAELIVVEQPAPPPALSRLEAFAEIDGLDTREKLRRFT
jgi:chemotaxis regulatin CheY-phosphate phosphatase CheZ